MCGIAGYMGEAQLDDAAISSTLRLMSNRGPDHQAFKVFSTNSNQVALLHSRLSIIDLESRSNQPFTIGKATIVFNGEIYNYLELRKELESKGISFRTNSDTEVLLRYYLEHGKACVDFFEGMWSFAIYDEAKQRLFLSRDRFAEKPLYFMVSDQGIYFASEIKFIRALSVRPISINKRRLLRHIKYGYKALYKSNETYFEGVNELKYAQNALIENGKISRLWRYWQPQVAINEQMTLEDAIEGTFEGLTRSLEIRLRADVPLAFCLSGGVDSAALASLAAKHFNRKIKTFSIIDSDERYNEEKNIGYTVNDLGCDHHPIRLSHSDSMERLSHLVEYHDAPIATISYLVHSMISEKMHEEGFRVSFSGTSADELFSGYYDHFLLHLNEVRERNDYQTYLGDWQKHVGKFVRNPLLKNPDLYASRPDFRDHVFDGSSYADAYLLEEFNEEHHDEHFTDNLMRNRMCNELFHEIVPVILNEDDLNSMLYSIENRSPYLDSKLLDFANSIPARHLVRNGYGKYVLRQSMKGILNEKVRLDRRKKGFNASISSLVDLQDPETKSYLLDSNASVFQIIDRKRIKALLKLGSIPNHLSKFIFNFINLRVFLEKF